MEGQFLNLYAHLLYLVVKESANMCRGAPFSCGRGVIYAGCWIWVSENFSSRNCPKRGRSGVSTVDLASIRTLKRPDKYHFGVPSGYVVGASDTFRTVS